VIAVKHLTPRDLFSLKAFIDPARISLAGFVNRYNDPNQTWMKDQWYYLQTAVLAAGHECLVDLFEVDVGVGRASVDGYDAIRFLKCGLLVKMKKRGRVFLDCGDVCRCPSCNKDMRVQPIKDEFLPVFGHERAPVSYGVTISATNNPETAGVHVEIGRDDQGEPIYEHLFLLKEVGTYPRLKRFSADEVDNVMTVVHSVFNFAHWLTWKGIFGGIGLVGDVDFSFYPDPSRPLGCGHSILPHAHGIGNTLRPLDRQDAEVMFAQYLKMLLKEGGGHLVAYPDIYLKPNATVEELEKTINYTIKPFKLAKFYIEGLRHGCPVVGLNSEFHQNAWTCESMFRGSSKHLVKFGNMHVNSRENYVGVHQHRTMTRNQVKEFLENLAKDEVSKKDIRRYENHLIAKEQERVRKLKRDRQKLAPLFAQFDRPANNQPEPQPTQL